MIETADGGKGSPGAVKTPAGPVAANMASQFDTLFGGKQSKLGVEAFRGFSGTFLKTIDGRVEQLVKAMESGDCKTAANLAHQLKASFGTLGAKEMTATCLEIETLYRNGPAAPPEVERFSHAVSGPISNLKKEVQDFLISLDAK